MSVLGKSPSVHSRTHSGSGVCSFSNLLSPGGEPQRASMGSINVSEFTGMSGEPEVLTGMLTTSYSINALTCCVCTEFHPFETSIIKQGAIISLGITTPLRSIPVDALFVIDSNCSCTVTDTY